MNLFIISIFLHFVCLVLLLAFEPIALWLLSIKAEFKASKKMFNSEERVKHIQVAIKLSDGRKLDGKLIISETSNLLRTLNGDGKFAVFVAHNGDHKLIAKSSIVEANEKQRNPAKSLSSHNDNGFDPYKILFIPHDADSQLIESQFKKLSRSYHPARYTHAEMPQEIAQYAIEMHKLVEQAYLSLTEQIEIVA